VTWWARRSGAPGEQGEIKEGEERGAMAIITHVLKDGKTRSYSVVLRLDGKQKWKRFATWKAADQYQTAVKRHRDKGTYVTLRSAPMAEVIDAWLGHLERRVTERDLKPGSLATFRSHVETHLRPTIGVVRSDRLTPEVIRRWVEGQAALIAKGRITPVTRNRNLIVFRMLLRWARVQHYLGGDPLAGVHRIKVKKAERRKTPMCILTPDEVDSLITAAPPPHDTILRVLAWTGLRIGEAFALRWEDIDGEAGRLHVRRRIYCGQIDTPKSEQSARTVDLPQALLDDLVAYQAMYPPIDEGYLFRDEHGTVLDVDGWRRGAFRRAVRAAGLDPSVTPHALRHSYASLLLSDPETPLKYASGQLGHASIQMTADVYADILPETRTTVMARLDATLRGHGANGKANGAGRSTPFGGGLRLVKGKRASA
jgi:integrase